MGRDKTRKKNHKLNLDTLSYRIDTTYVIPTIVGVSKTGNAYEISYNEKEEEYTYTPFSVESIGDTWKRINPQQAREIAKSMNLKTYIEESNKRNIEKGGKPFGKVFKYYQNDLDMVYAIDEKGNHYRCYKTGMLMADHPVVDCMWGGLFEEEAWYYIKRN